MPPFVCFVISLWQSCAGHARAPFVFFVSVVIVPLAVLSAVADPQIRLNPRNLRFPFVGHSSQVAGELLY